MSCNLVDWSLQIVPRYHGTKPPQGSYGKGGRGISDREEEGVRTVASIDYYCESACHTRNARCAIGRAMLPLVCARSSVFRLS